MSTFSPLLDSFERLMAAVAFAECNDRETACWILKSGTPQTLVRVANELKQPAASRPELRL